MSVEARIQEAFPGRENANLRCALYAIAWAFEPSSLGDERMLNALFTTALSSRSATGWDMAILKGAVEDLVKELLALASRLDDATRRIEIAELDERSRQRGL